MNCWEFEKVVMDVARSETQGVRMDASVKQNALAHAQHCSHCAACLVSEKSLSLGLRAVAVDDDVLPLPAALETHLLAAFRAQHAVEVAAPVVREVVTASPFKLLFWRMRWAFATVAVALLVLAVARGMQSSSAPDPQQANAPARPAPSVIVAPPPVPDSAPVVPEKIAPPPNLLVRAGRQEGRATQVKAKWPPAEQRGRVTVEVGEFVVDEPESISANEFLVFDYARNLPPADSTQLMRVRMPSERLAPLGIQVPRTVRNNGFVNADLLVGSDGVPRAIRVADR